MIVPWSEGTRLGGAEDAGEITGKLIVTDHDGLGSDSYSVTIDASHGTATVDAGTGEWSYFKIKLLKFKISAT
jgi:hypothetical protein